MPRGAQRRMSFDVEGDPAPSRRLAGAPSRRAGVGRTGRAARRTPQPQPRTKSKKKSPSLWARTAYAPTGFCKIKSGNRMCMCRHTPHETGKNLSYGPVPCPAVASGPMWLVLSTLDGRSYRRPHGSPPPVSPPGFVPTRLRAKRAKSRAGIILRAAYTASAASSLPAAVCLKQLSQRRSAAREEPRRPSSSDSSHTSKAAATTSSAPAAAPDRFSTFHRSPSAAITSFWLACGIAFLSAG